MKDNFVLIKVKQVLSKIKNGFTRFFHTLSRLNWLGRGILLGFALTVAAAITLPLVLTKQAPAVSEQLATIPTATAIQTIAPIEPMPTPIPTTQPAPTIDPVLEKGDESIYVQALQDRLMDLGYMEIDESTLYFGPATKYAVELFQRQHGLQQDGIAGYETLNAIFTDGARPYTLLEGTKGTDVDGMQQQLVDLGYMSLITGYYGTDTVSAVKDFQTRNKLTVDGKTGEQTLELLYSPDAIPSASFIIQERRSANISEMIAIAQAQLGKPYILGRSGPNSFDCSGLVYYCLKQAGSSRRRYNASGYSNVSEWEKIMSYDDLQKGDLLFFWISSRGKIGHVGIYVGDGMMIDASSSNGKVVHRSIHSPYWVKWFRWARRPW
ncbi:MAG: hypothetical protein HN948_00865 [Clostridia bacterium]|nr:hypothetical protein [Clostridia bacterium]MBT7121540.1 hypothetical protein [Clostridia bacterium]